MEEVQSVCSWLRVRLHEALLVVAGWEFRSLELQVVEHMISGHRASEMSRIRAPVFQALPTNSPPCLAMDTAQM